MRDVPVYTDAAFVTSAHAWARETCATSGFAITGAIEQPHVRPWSTVFRVPTDRGFLFLKCCGRSQAHEPRLTALLEATHPDLVPHLIALHPTEPWMLVMDGGAKLREVESGPALDAWSDVLPRYAQLQRDLAPRVGDLLGVGTPDHRLESVPSLFEAMLHDDRVIGAADEAPLTRAERDWLLSLLPRIADDARALDALGIPPTIQHDDLHDGNVLVRDGTRVIFDWGDACVSHPFFSLLIVIRHVTDKGGISARAPEVLRLRDLYLEPWTAVAPRRTLLTAYSFVPRLGAVAHVLTWHRVGRFAQDSALPYIARSEIHWLREILELYV